MGGLGSAGLTLGLFSIFELICEDDNALQNRLYTKIERGLGSVEKTRARTPVKASLPFTKWLPPLGSNQGQSD